MSTTTAAQDLATTEALIARQTELVGTLFIQRTDSDAAEAFYSLQVGVLDDLQAFKLATVQRAERVTQTYMFAVDFGDGIGWVEHFTWRTNEGSARAYYAAEAANFAGYDTQLRRGGEVLVQS